MANPGQIQDQQSRFERLLAQQLLVRRFRIENPEEFSALQGFRDQMHSIIEASSSEEDGMWPGEVQQALAAWLLVAETPDVRDAVRENDLGALRHRLGGPAQLSKWNSTLQPTLDFLAEQLPVIESLIKRFNYFDHCSLMSMASLCRGEDFLHAYGSAWLRPVTKWAKELQALNEAENKRGFDLFWIPTLSWSLDLKCAVGASWMPERFLSSSVHILDSRTAPVMEVDGPLQEALYLRIDLCRAPVDIDAALTYFRGALLERLSEVHGSIDCAPGADEFLKTAFALTKSSPAKLFKDYQTLASTIRGLWCWDLTELQNMSGAQAARTIGDACEQAGNERIGEQSLLKQRSVVAKLVAAASGAGALDELVTRRRGLRLGFRQPQAKPAVQQTTWYPQPAP